MLQTGSTLSDNGNIYLIVALIVGHCGILEPTSKLQDSTGLKATTTKTQAIKHAAKQMEQKGHSGTTKTIR